MTRIAEILEEELGPVEAAELIAKLEDALRDMVRYDQWAEASGCDCQVCEIKRRVRELLEKP